MNPEVNQDLKLEAPRDLIDFDMSSRLDWVLDARPREYLTTLGLETLERIRETGLLEGEPHTISIAAPDELTGLTIEDEASAKRLVFDYLIIEARRREVEGFDLIVYDPDTITVNFEDGILVSGAGKAQLYSVNHEKAKQVVEHFTRPEFEESFDDMLREASIAAGKSHVAES